MRKVNKILFIFMFCSVAIHINAIKVFAKPISNVFQATINVLDTGITVGNGEENDYTDINKAIENAKEGSNIKIKGGEYKLNNIIDKDIKLESLDGKYVDIVVESELPNKIEVGDKVTINKEGVPPINIEIKLMDGKNTTILKGEEIKINAKQGESIKLSINGGVNNKLGFHSSKLKLKLLENDGVILESDKKDTVIDGVKLNDGVYYNLGEFGSYPCITINLKFNKAGEYPIKIWADDGR